MLCLCTNPEPGECKHCVSEQAWDHDAQEFVTVCHEPEDALWMSWSVRPLMITLKGPLLDDEEWARRFKEVSLLSGVVNTDAVYDASQQVFCEPGTVLITSLHSSNPPGGALITLDCAVTLEYPTWQHERRLDGKLDTRTPPKYTKISFAEIGRQWTRMDTDVTT